MRMCVFVCTARRAAPRISKLSIVEILLHGGAEVDAPTGDGATALHMAAEYDHFDVVRLLLQKGADMNWVRRDTSGVHDKEAYMEGCSVLAAAQLWGNHAVADLLQQAGAESIGKKELSVIKAIFFSVRKICLSLWIPLSLFLWILFLSLSLDLFTGNLLADAAIIAGCIVYLRPDMQ